MRIKTSSNKILTMDAEAASDILPDTGVDENECKEEFYDFKDDDDVNEKTNEGLKSDNFKNITNAPEITSPAPDKNVDASTNKVEIDNKTNIPDKISKRRKRARSSPNSPQPSTDVSIQSPEHKQQKKNGTDKISPIKRGVGSEEKYLLIVSNLPKSWTFIETKMFIQAQSDCLLDQMTVMESGEDFVNVQLSFDSYYDCKQIMDTLLDKEVEGTKLGVQIKEQSDADMIWDSTAQTDVLETKNPTAENDSTKWKPDLDFWDIDPEGLYGLSRKFLKFIDVEPPIDRLLHVTNFRCDKAELRDVLEMAGHVVMCTVETINYEKHAKVLYSHPLEAIQAISMLHNHSLYGRKLKLTMERCPIDVTILPKGMYSLGLGFGKNGKPLKNVSAHYRRYVNNKASSLNPFIFNDQKEDQNNINNGNTVKKQKKAWKDQFVFEPEFGPSANVRSVLDFFDYECAEAENDWNAAYITSLEENVNSNKQYPNKYKKRNHFYKSKKNSSKQNVSQTQNTSISSGVGPQTTQVPQAVPAPASGIVPQTTQVAQAVPAPASGIVSQTTQVPQAVPAPANPTPFVDPNVNSGIQRPNFTPQYVPPATFRPAVASSWPNVSHGPLQGGLHPGPSVNGHQDAHRPFIRPSAPQVPLRPTTGAVQLSNLPLTTTFPLLYDQLSTCGQITSLQFTTPGCANVSFANPAQAELCMNKFNGLNVEGYVITAAYM